MTNPGSTSRPFFSIVMPTREKAHLLKYALQSAVSQTFDDYEIVVCDNNSMDGTREVVHELADERLRYVRTEERLSMPDNWEFALEHARGEYVTYLCDDDAAGPRLLEKLYSILEDTSNVSVGWRGGTYVHPDWPEKQARNSLLFPDRATGDVSEVSSSSLLGEMFALEYREQYPRLLNSCCSREFLEQRKRRMGGRLFFPTCPDYSAAVATLTDVDSTLFIDDHLVVFGLAAASNGSYGFAGTDAIQTFMSEFADLDKIWRIPLSSSTNYNHIAVTLIGLKDVLAEELAPYSWSLVRLFVRERQEIELMRSRGADVRRIRGDWDRALAAQSATVQRSVRRQIKTALLGSGVDRLKTAIGKRFPEAVRGTHSLRGLLNRQGVGVKEPSRYEFGNIYEAARSLEKLP